MFNLTLYAFQHSSGKPTIVTIALKLRYPKAERNADDDEQRLSEPASSNSRSERACFHGRILWAILC